MSSVVLAALRWYLLGAGCTLAVACIAILGGFGSAQAREVFDRSSAWALLVGVLGCALFWPHTIVGVVANIARRRP